MKDLFDAWGTVPEWDVPSSKEPCRSGLREALYKVLKDAYKRPANEARRDPKPWQDFGGPSPKSYLGKVVWETAKRTKNRQEEKARLWGKLSQEPLLDLDAERHSGTEGAEESYRLLNDDQVQVLEILTGDKNPIPRALAAAALEDMSKGAAPADILRAAGAEWWQYQEFQRKASRLLEKSRKNLPENP